MKSEITNEHLKMSNEDLEVIMQNGLITIKKIEKENYTLEDLKQSLINRLNSLVINKNDLASSSKLIELLRIILESEKNTNSIKSKIKTTDDSDCYLHCKIPNIYTSQFTTKTNLTGQIDLVEIFKNMPIKKREEFIENLLFVQKELNKKD